MCAHKTTLLQSSSGEWFVDSLARRDSLVTGRLVTGRRDKNPPDVRRLQPRETFIMRYASYTSPRGHPAEIALGGEARVIPNSWGGFVKDGRRI